MKKIIALCLLVAFGGMLSACNTVKGFGKDVEHVGEKNAGLQVTATAASLHRRLLRGLRPL
ncbi:entericidin A/B family lipoprotein [Undibacterium arcticum]